MTDLGPKQPLLDQMEGGKEVYEAADICTRQQINQAIKDVEDMHPLRTRAKFEHIVPSLSIFRRCIKKKPDFKHSLRQTLLAEMDLKLPKNEHTLMEEPFLILGYGINAYFDIMMSLSIMCLVITAFLLPVYYIYGTTAEGIVGGSPLNKFTLGNLGGAQALCLQQDVNRLSLQMSCPVGNIIIGSKTHIGMMSSNIKQQIFCTESAIADFVSTQTGSQIENCTAKMTNLPAIKDSLVQNCHGKSSCTFDFSSFVTQDDSECGKQASLYI